MKVVAKYCLLHIFNYIIIGKVGAWKYIQTSTPGLVFTLCWWNCIIQTMTGTLAYMDGEARRLNTRSLTLFCFNCCKKWEQFTGNE